MLSDTEFSRLLKFLDRPWSGFRKVRKGVKKRVRRHMTALGCTTLDAYLAILEQRPAERRQCEQALLVAISRFFRDRHLWRVLGQRILPDLINRFTPPIRIWSAGCASGEEAYSLAITWAQLDQPPAMELLATDTRTEALDRARQAIYPQSSLKEAPDRIQSKFFRAQGKHRHIVQTHRLPTIFWQQHDLLDPPPAHRFHMILLRNNLLTYHQGETLEVALEQLVTPLTPGGYMVVGSHERLPDIRQRFTRDVACPFIYRLKAAG